MNIEQVEELVLQSYEHEIGGVKLYEAALGAVVHPGLEKEFRKYLAETKQHVTALESVCAALGIDPARETPGRKVVRHNGQALVEAVQMAIAAGDPAAAQIVACECVVLAETKDHADWQLIGKVGQHLEGAKGAALKAAYDQFEDQEDEHLYHTKGWCRELWIESLGMHAVLPPPEEVRKVTTAIGAAKAEQAAEKER
ncbi:MAG: hypothetical protein JWP97_2880 [Labilithrix sp.]|nr:hypothetical protein [Labilithrix sp.]